jgi:hypothetical protein
LLRKGKEGIEELRHEAGALGVATQEEADSALELEESQKRLELAHKSVGRTIMQLLMPGLKLLSSIMVSIAKWAHEHPTVIKVAFLGIAAAIAVLGVNAAIAAISMLAISWPLVAIAAGVGLLAAGVAWLAMKWKDLGDGVKVMLGPIAWIVMGVQFLIAKWKEWKAAGEETNTAMGKFFATVVKVWTGIKEAIAEALRTVRDLIENYVGIWIDTFKLIFALFSGDKGKIQEAWSSLMKHMEKTFHIVVNVLIGAFAMYCGFMVRIFKEAWGLIINTLKGHAEDIQNLPQRAFMAYINFSIKAFKEAWELMGAFLRNYIKYVIDIPARAFLNFFGSLIKMFQAAWKQIVNFARSHVADLDPTGLLANKEKARQADEKTAEAEASLAAREKRMAEKHAQPSQPAAPGTPSSPQVGATPPGQPSAAPRPLPGPAPAHPSKPTPVDVRVAVGGSKAPTLPPISTTVKVGTTVTPPTAKPIPAAGPIMAPAVKQAATQMVDIRKQVTQAAKPAPAVAPPAPPGATVVVQTSERTTTKAQELMAYMAQMQKAKATSNTTSSTSKTVNMQNTYNVAAPDPKAAAAEVAKTQTKNADMVDHAMGGIH